MAPKRLIIAGSRTFTWLTNSDIEKLVSEHFRHTQILICGMAQGIDMAGYKWAKNAGIPIEKYPAEWSLHGKKAGIIRNRVMQSKADALLAIWDGKSRGTKDMILCMLHNDKPIHVELWLQDQ